MIQNISQIQEIPETVAIGYLGLADLGKTAGDDVTDPYAYAHDGDNYLDICLDMSSTPQGSHCNHIGFLI